MKTNTYAQNPNTQQLESAYEIISNETLEAQNFNGLTIAGSLFSLSIFKGTAFKDCVFYGTKFENCMFLDCSFENCNFQFSHLDFCHFYGCTFAKCNWDFTPIHKSQFACCTLDFQTTFQVEHIDRENKWNQCLRYQDDKNVQDAQSGLFAFAA